MMDTYEKCWAALVRVVERLEETNDPNEVNAALLSITMQSIEFWACPGCARLRIAYAREALDKIESGLPLNMHKH
jgi:hypothetical protein